MANFDAVDLRHMAEHGANQGQSGLIYHQEMTALYEKNKSEIWEMVIEDSEAFRRSPYAFLASLEGAEYIGDYSQHASLLVQYAAERIAYEETFGKEEENREPTNHTLEQTQERAQLQARLGKDQQITQERQKAQSQTRQAQQSRDRDERMR